MQKVSLGVKTAGSFGQRMLVPIKSRESCSTIKELIDAIGNYNIAALRFIHVVDDDAVETCGDSPLAALHCLNVQDLEVFQAEQYLQELCNWASDCFDDVDVSFLVTTGDVTESLLHESDVWNADVLVILASAESVKFKPLRKNVLSWLTSRSDKVVHIIKPAE